MRGSKRKRSPLSLRPSTSSIQTRYIHPLDPVYHVQPPSPDVPLQGVDVGGDDVRLHLIAGDGLWLPGVFHRVEQAQQFDRAVAVPLAGKGHRQPQGAVGVLAAVLAHAGG